MGKLAGRTQVQSPHYHYIGGQTLTNPDGQQLTIPSTATIVEIASEDAESYYDIGQVASASSPGYVAAEGRKILGPMDLSNGVWVHGGSAVVHVMYFKEA